MNRVNVELGSRSYPIWIGSGLLGDAALVSAAISARQILVVTNDVVAPLYLDRLRAAMRYPASVCVLPDGEQHKTLGSFGKIVDQLIDDGFHRDCCVVALGGGVIGDVAGFAAAAYQRGVDFVQVPTTLLAQVDSSVGGKTGVNHPRAKNMVGAFHQPRAVIADMATLRTLPPRELSAGIAEIVKYGLIADAALFEWLETNVEALVALDAAALAHAVKRSCEIKAAIVAEDEREQGRRALLNFGHTFGHALESIGRYERWLHGEAVAIGMLMAARASEALGTMEPDSLRRIEALLRRARLPVDAAGVEPADMLELMRLDKKAFASGMRVVLLERIGSASVVPAPADDVLTACIRACTAPT